ncbi:Klc [Symbiodinium natans]|uniref:Klc protein n=1 Tax=Symbiodinium natans TaxID=878477 RepID=A0A812NNK6_9DINO|nr:Klc [Symbiodinium natans]
MIALAYSLWQDGQRGEAEELYKRALLISESTLGPAHDTTLHCLNNLAAIAKELGRQGELDRLLGRRPGEKRVKAIER